MKPLRIDYEDILNVLYETIDVDNYVIALYIVEAPVCFPPDMIARAFATEQTTGTWIRIPAKTPDMRKRLGGKALIVCESPD